MCAEEMPGVDVGIRVVLAVRLVDRLIGLLPDARRLHDADAMLIAPCSGIHTVGMRCEIDVAFIDSRGMIVRVREHVRPFSRMRCRGAVAVLERPSPPCGCHYPDVSRGECANAGNWPTEGDRLEFCAGSPGLRITRSRADKGNSEMALIDPNPTTPRVGFGNKGSAPLWEVRNEEVPSMRVAGIR